MRLVNFMKRTHYQNLKIAEDAPREVIRAAHKALIAKYHPDRYGPEGEKICKIISESFHTLMNPATREKHDQSIRDINSKLAKDADIAGYSLSKIGKLAQIPEYISLLISIHCGVSTFLSWLVAVFRRFLRLFISPLALLVYYAIIAGIGMKFFAESAFLEELLDKYLVRRDPVILNDGASSILTSPRTTLDIIELANIPAGRFFIGSTDPNPDENPYVDIPIDAFKMMTKEVTFELWDKCVFERSCDHIPQDNGGERRSSPVVDVSYEDVAEDFIPWLNTQTELVFYLPSEAQWEYAAKGGKPTRYYWGDQFILNLANCSTQCGDAYQYPSVGGEFPANPFGLFDMVGNVWEMTSDCGNIGHRNNPGNGSPATKGDCSRMITKGGSFGSSRNDLRPARRARIEKDRRERSIGFRLALD
jgi:formylglycine-generating enzyme required for sulfatase activity/curved DNA-binding protein CbpA